MAQAGNMPDRKARKLLKDATLVKNMTEMQTHPANIGDSVTAEQECSAIIIKYLNYTQATEGGKGIYPTKKDTVFWCGVVRTEQKNTL